MSAPIIVSINISGKGTASNVIPLSVPQLEGNELRYLTEAVETNWVSSEGPFVRQFEKQFQDLFEGATAVAVVNGTSALHIALLVAGVKPGEEVLVPALTFVATANAAAYCGAHPAFIDADPNTWGMDPVKLKDFIDKGCLYKKGELINRKTRRKIAAILPVHLLGHPVDMDIIMTVAKQYALPVIEDACEALGALYKGRRAGALGDIACFSFNGNKIVTAGGGGMIVTRNTVWAKRARYLTTQARDTPQEYIHGDIGFNYRLTNLQAAVGCAQMECLPHFLIKKAEIAQTYRKAFASSTKITSMPSEPWASPTNWLFTIRLKKSAPQKLILYLKENGIESRRLWRPMHLLPMYKKEFAYEIDFAERLYEDSVSLPSSVGLSKADQTQVIQAVLSYMDSH